MVKSLLPCVALVVALASAGEVMVPEVTELPDAQKVLLTLTGGTDDAAFCARSIGGEERRATCRLPSEGLEQWKLALVAQTVKDGSINGFSFVTWKPAEAKPEHEWPELKEIPGALARIRGAEALVLHQLASTEKDAKWSFEIISFRKMESGEDEEAILRAKKQIIEEGGTRLVEAGRFTLVAPAPPSERLRYGVVVVPVWKETGKILDGFDAQLATTPSPASPGGA
jgi:hypothetical protein